MDRVSGVDGRNFEPGNSHKNKGEDINNCESCFEGGYLAAEEKNKKRENKCEKGETDDDYLMSSFLSSKAIDWHMILGSIIFCLCNLRRVRL